MTKKQGKFHEGISFPPESVILYKELHIVQVISESFLSIPPVITSHIAMERNQWTQLFLNRGNLHEYWYC